MSGSFTHGMHLAEVEELGRLLQARGDLLRTLAMDVERAVGSTTWAGPDATTFTQQWWPDHRTRLQQVAEQLTGFGQSALNNATEQRDASGVTGTTGGTSGGGTVGGGGAGGGAPGTTGSTVTAPRDWREVRDKYDAWATGRFAAGRESHYQCTAWANFRWQELGYDGVIGGNGGAMAGNAGPVSSEPALHAMASYGAGTRENPGHVMIVEEISSDGSRIRVSEMNTDSNWNVGTPQEYRDTKWITRGADGVFRSHRGEAIRFAGFPG